MQTFQDARQGSRQKLSWAQHYAQLGRTLNIHQSTWLYRQVTRPFQHDQCEDYVHSSRTWLKATQSDKLCDPTHYQELTVSLNHLAIFSRPDISFAVSKLAQFNVNPTMTHWT